MTSRVGDVKLTYWTQTRAGGQSVKVNLPLALARALASEGYDRAEVFVTDEGILLKPYLSDDITGRKTLNLPAWPKK